ncbi:MAG TPA: hypothetical protein VE690_23695 [Rhodopila sp.]|nr:hypothetical protein [Rhodopila sp.]
MKLLLAVLAPCAALAQGVQQPGEQPPIQQQWHLRGADPLLSPNAPAPPDAQQAAPALPDPQQERAEPFTRPNIWVPAREAKIQALDKVNAQSSDLVIKVG